MSNHEPWFDVEMTGLPPSRAYWENMVQTRPGRRRLRRRRPLDRLMLGYGIAMTGSATLLAFGLAVWTFVTGGEYWGLGFVGIVLGFGFAAATIGLLALWREETPRG